MCLAISIYVIGYGFELRSQNVEQIKFFLKMEYFGLPFMAAFWLLFSYKFYYNRYSPLNMNIAVLTIPVLTLFFSVTNEYHHLFYSSVSAVQYDGFILAHLTKGPWYFVNVAYSYIALLAGAFAFLRTWYFSFYTMRTQAMLMFAGTIFPGVVNLFYLAGMSPYGIDLTPFGLSISAVCYFFALFRYDLLELGEIIRSVAFAEISEGIIVADDKKRLLDFNNAAKKIFIWLDAKNIGISLTDFEIGREITEHGENSFELELMQDGAKKYYEFRTTDLREKNRRLGSVYFIRDVTRLKEMIRELDNMASYDSLTQVYNRRRFMDEAEKEVLRVKRHGSCFSILMLDIDFFKGINDNYGHMAGDEVIKSVIAAIRERVRRTDIVGRYGGEEFIVLLSEASLENALNIAENIRSHIGHTEVLFQEARIPISVSIGVSSVAGDQEDTDLMQAIHWADMALYDAKNRGKDRVSGRQAGV